MADEKIYPNPKPGTVAARCVRVVSLGTHMKQWKEEEPKALPKVMLTWEISEKMDDGKPFAVQCEYTAIVSDSSNLGKAIASWMPLLTKDEIIAFDIYSLVGEICLLTITVNKAKSGKIYTNVKNVVAMPEGFPAPEAYNDLFTLNLATDMKDDEKLLKVWGLERYILKKSNEYIGKSFVFPAYVAPTETPSDVVVVKDDDIPFDDGTDSPFD